MDRIDAYLDELVSVLDCDPLRRDEIRLEVHSHLRELMDEERRAGKPEQEAVVSALERFGPVEEVAPGLAVANRGRSPEVPRRHRPWALLQWSFFAGLVVWFLISWASDCRGGHRLWRPALLHGAEMPWPPHVRSAFASLVRYLHPMGVVLLVLAPAFALLTRRFTLRRRALWSALALGLLPAILALGEVAVALGAGALEGVQMRPGSGWDMLSGVLLFGATGAAGPVWLFALAGALATIALPWAGRSLDSCSRRLPLVLFVAALPVLVLWGNPLFVAVEELVNPSAGTDHFVPWPSWAAILWGGSRLVAFALAARCAAAAGLRLAQSTERSSPAATAALVGAVVALPTCFVSLEIPMSLAAVDGALLFRVVGYTALMALGAASLAAAVPPQRSSATLVHGMPQESSMPAEPREASECPISTTG